MTPFQPADIGDLVDVGEPRVSPDGNSIAYVVTRMTLDDNDYRQQIFVVPADGSADAVAICPADGRCSKPRWSPDGRRLAFVRSDEPESGLARSEICIVGASGGDVTQVVDWPDAVDELAWSPDGGRIAFVGRQPEEERYGRTKPKDQPPRRVTNLFYKLDNVGWTVDRQRHLFVVPADGSAPPQPVTGGPFEDGGLAWSPDGERLAFASARHPDWDLTRAVDLFVIDAGGGNPVRLTGTDLAWSKPSWSADGERIAGVVCDERTAAHHPQIAVLGLGPVADAPQPMVLTAALDRNCAPYGGSREPVWDGDALWFLVEDSGNTTLHRVDSSGAGKPERVVGGDRVITGFDVAGGTVAFCATTPTCSAELFVLDADGEERRLTHVGDDFRARVELVAPLRFTATSTGGAEVEAWAMPPAGAEPGRRYPTLLNIHGGPFTQYGNRLFDEFQMQAGAGFAVVYANPRGSSGYSEAWGRAILWPELAEEPGSGWGGLDYDDLMAVIDEACRQFDFIDPERLGVLGGSYGGYMATWIVGHNDRFKAACSERAVNDMLMEEADSDIASTFTEYVGVSHLDDPEPYRRQSPITYVKDITTPMLIVHSDGDLRCPASQGEALFVALRLLGREVEMVRFPGEGHELSRSGAPRHRVQRAEIILEFFRRHLTD